MWWLPKDEGWAFLYGQEMIGRKKMHILCCKDGSEGFTKQKRKGEVCRVGKLVGQ